MNAKLRVATIVARAVLGILVAAPASVGSPAGGDVESPPATRAESPATVAADPAVAAQPAPAENFVSERQRNVQTAQLLRIRRMAATWTNNRIEVVTLSGVRTSGRFVRMDESVLRLAPSEGTLREIPVRELYQISIKRRHSDLAFVAALALGSGALLAGIGALGAETDGGGTAVLAASGFLLGATIGWRSVYQDRVITLE